MRFTNENEQLKQFFLQSIYYFIRTLVSSVSVVYNHVKAGHEIKTPLTIINANVDLLELDEEKEELAEIRQQTKRLTELTNNLVLLSKMEETGHTLQKIEFPLSDLVHETAASFRAPAAAGNIELAINVTPDITLNGSPDSIRQLVLLLLDNAVKYTPPNGKITLDLYIHRKSAVISVRNTARDSIKNADLERIFDRFYRTDSSRNSETGGYGIGLSIAKAITDLHGGGICASTNDGRTIFPDQSQTDTAAFIWQKSPSRTARRFLRQTPCDDKTEQVHCFCRQ